MYDIVTLESGSAVEKLALYFIMYCVMYQYSNIIFKDSRSADTSTNSARFPNFLNDLTFVSIHDVRSASELKV